jgi:heptosyltransferase-2
MTLLKKMIREVYFVLRLPFIFLLKCVYPPRARTSASFANILIVRIDRMGDLILTLPLIDNLKLALPESSISIVVRPYLKELAELIKSIDHIEVYDKIIPAAGKIRRAGYDLAIDMHCDYRLDSAFLAYISAAPVRAGFRFGFKELFFTHTADPLGSPGKNMARLNLELLKRLQIPVTVDTPKLGPGTGGGKDDIIAIHPGGFYATQRWDKSSFALLAKKLLGTYPLKIVVLGAPGEKDLVNDIVAEINDGRATARLTDIKTLISVLSGCKLLICNNSGPLHLAGALGAPVVSLMGPTDPLRYSPAGKQAAVIRKGLACSPCSKGECSSHACMKAISIEDVFQAVKVILQKEYGIT